MELNIIESLKERRDFGRSANTANAANTAHIDLVRREGRLSLSVSLKEISPSGLICFSTIGFCPGEVVIVRIPHMKGIFESGARVIGLKKLLNRYELELNFFEIRRDIPSL